LPAVFSAASNAILLWIGIGTISRGDLPAGSIFLLISIPISLLITWVLILGLADISVDDAGLRRKAFGIVWQEVKWKDVSSVRIFNTTNPDNGKKVRSFLLITKGAPLASRRIGFQESSVNMEPLAQEVVRQVAIHAIRAVDKTTAS